MRVLWLVVLCAAGAGAGEAPSGTVATSAAAAAAAVAPHNPMVEEDDIFASEEVPIATSPIPELPTRLPGRRKLTPRASAAAAAAEAYRISTRGLPPQPLQQQQRQPQQQQQLQQPKQQPLQSALPKFLTPHHIFKPVQPTSSEQGKPLKLSTLFRKFKFKGYGLSFVKSLTSWSQLGLGVRIPITPNFKVSGLKTPILVLLRHLVPLPS